MDTAIAQQQTLNRLRFPQQGLALSPPELSPTSYYDLQADFSADSAPSRGSPVSPVFGNPFQLPLPLDSDWPAYLDKPDMSPDMASDFDVFYGESFGGPMAFMNTQNPTLSPTANPLDLMSDSVTFGQDDFNDAVPLFQSPGGLQPATAITTSPSAEVPRKTTEVASPKVQTRSQRTTQRLPTRSSDLKRKSPSSDSGSSRSSSPEPPARRTKRADPSKNPHNLIEKRYRVNINDKILALRDAVPALRCVVHQQDGAEPEEVEAGGEDLGGLMPARKLNKATILSKATEYINHLEKKNVQLAQEVAELEKRFADVERWQRSQVDGNSYWA